MARVLDASALLSALRLDPHQLHEAARMTAADFDALALEHAGEPPYSEDSRQEISACRERLEAATGRSVRHFAYPFENRAVFGPREEQFAWETLPSPRCDCAPSASEP